MTAFHKRLERFKLQLDLKEQERIDKEKAKLIKKLNIKQARSLVSNFGWRFDYTINQNAIFKTSNVCNFENYQNMKEKIKTLTNRLNLQETKLKEHESKPFSLDRMAITNPLQLEIEGLRKEIRILKRKI